MSTLDAKERDALPDADFAFPKQRKEPLENASHVRYAIARFKQVKDSATPNATRRGNASSPPRRSTA